MIENQRLAMFIKEIRFRREAAALFLIALYRDLKDAFIVIIAYIVRTLMG